MKPLVSILIPAYNAERFIAATIRSALDQSWPSKEIIVVDDGSKDATFSIAKRFASADVHVLRQTNCGASAARNAAYARSSGEYIQWLDSDDLLGPHKVEWQLNAIMDNSLGPNMLVSGAWAYFRYLKRRAMFSPSPLWESLTPVEWLTRKLGQNLHMQPNNWLVSRELTEKAGPWDESLSHDDDGEYFARVIKASKGTHFVPTAKSYYRSIGFGSLSHVSGNTRKLESLYRSMCLHIRYLLALEDSDRTRAACLFYIGTWLHEFYPYRPDIVEELKVITRELGGQFKEPRLSAKYQWLVKVAGWSAARRAQILLPRLRWSAAIAYDRLLWECEVDR